MYFNNKIDIGTVEKLCRGYLLLLSVALIIGCTSQKPRIATPQTPITPTPSSLTGLDQSQYEKALNHLHDETPQKAKNILEKLNRKYDTHEGIKINLAISYFKLGDYEKAESTCAEGLKVNQNIPQLYNLLGLIYVESKKFKQAEGKYLRAIAQDKNYANAYYNLALLYDIYFQDIPKAYQNYIRYLAMTPDDNEAKDWVEQLKYSLDQE